MRGAGVLVVCLVAVGCDTTSRGNYDPVKDVTSISIQRQGSFAEGPTIGKPELSLLLEGKGKRPQKWGAMLSIAYHDPELDNFWGQTPYLTRRRCDRPGESIEGHRSGIKKSEPGKYYEALFLMEIDELVGLVDCGKYELNGKEFSLTAEDKQSLTNAIIEARTATNSAG